MNRVELDAAMAEMDEDGSGGTTHLLRGIISITIGNDLGWLRIAYVLRCRY
eukprot:COSAG01_NODE_19580_length_1002_cov_1.569214_1_plen_50_part_10